MSSSIQRGTVKIYYNGSSQAEMGKLADEVNRRLMASGFYDSSRTDRVFFFQNEKLYSFFVKLSLLKHTPQGFNLSIFGNSYVNGPFIKRLAESTAMPPKYSIHEGSYGHIIAHEIAHQYIIDRIGRTGWLKLPHWKQEGLPEYIANIGLIRRDTLLTLHDRVNILNDETAWYGSNEWNRIHYEAELLIEYLFDVAGYSLEDIVSDNINKYDTRNALNRWSAEQGNGL
jgi:hypothetical protein